MDEIDPHDRQIVLVVDDRRHTARLLGVLISAGLGAQVSELSPEDVIEHDPVPLKYRDEVAEMMVVVSRSTNLDVSPYCVREPRVKDWESRKRQRPRKRKHR